MTVKALTVDSKKESAADDNSFSNLTKTFEQFKMPGLDTNAFMDARRKDLDAMVAANKITYEALQNIANMQTTMLTQAMQGMQEFATGAMAGSPAGSDMTKQTDATQKAWHKMLDDMKQLAEMVQKAQVDVMAALTERAKASLGEMTGLVNVK